MIINFNPALYAASPLKTNSTTNVKSSNLAPLKKDTVSFSGAIQKELLHLAPERIIMECRKALKEGNIIGEGQEAIVYKIDSFPKYCLRREKLKAENPANFTLNYQLNKYDKVNHVVAKLDEGTQLMEYISGIPLKIMPHRDTPDGIQLKKAVKGLIANNFPESSFKKIINQVEDAKNKGIDFDRKGENLLVEAVNQEFNCIDYSPKFHDIEYNPVSYLYSAMDVDGTEHAPKVFGKLCKAYAQRIADVPVSRLNLGELDTNFYARGFMDDAFNQFPDKALLKETQERLETLLKEKQNPENNRFYMNYLAEEFKDFIDEKIVPLKHKKWEVKFWEPEMDN